MNILKLLSTLWGTIDDAIEKGKKNDGGGAGIKPLSPEGKLRSFCQYWFMSSFNGKLDYCVTGFGTTIIVCCVAHFNFLFFIQQLSNKIKHLLLSGAVSAQVLHRGDLGGRI